MWLGISLLALLGGIGWLVRRHGSRRDRGMATSDWDDAELRAAEDEVRDLDVMASPEDAADTLPDWGPGAPKG